MCTAPGSACSAAAPAAAPEHGPPRPAPTRPPPQAGEEKNRSGRSTAPSACGGHTAIPSPACEGRPAIPPPACGRRTAVPPPACGGCPRHLPSRLREGLGEGLPATRPCRAARPRAPPGLPRKRGRRRIAAAAPPPPPPAKAAPSSLLSPVVRPAAFSLPPAEAVLLSPLPLAGGVGGGALRAARSCRAAWPLAPTRPPPPACGGRHVISPPACGRGWGRVPRRGGSCRTARPLAPSRPPPQAGEEKNRSGRSAAAYACGGRTVISPPGPLAGAGSLDFVAWATISLHKVS